MLQMDERLENPISDRTDGKRVVLFQDESIKNVINNGFKTIFSNYDAWYFDCGYGNWVGDGNNWCAPYKSKSYTIGNKMTAPGLKSLIASVLQFRDKE